MLYRSSVKRVCWGVSRFISRTQHYGYITLAYSDAHIYNCVCNRNEVAYGERCTLVLWTHDNGVRTIRVTVEVRTDLDCTCTPVRTYSHRSHKISFMNCQPRSLSNITSKAIECPTPTLARDRHSVLAFTLGYYQTRHLQRIRIDRYSD